MTSKEFLFLHRHTQKHIPDLRIRPEVLQKRFAAGCSMNNCNAKCCRAGVHLDIGDQKRILDHADLVRKYMEPHQEKDSSGWFEELKDDKDFPSGQCVSTQVKHYGCVFLDNGGRCVLQKAAIAEGMPRFSLKPYFCVAYPVTIENGEIITDDPDFTYRTECCSTVEKGDLTVLDVCSMELEFMFGKEGLEELKEFARAVPGKEKNA